jgi:hypothetical protein
MRAKAATKETTAPTTYEELLGPIRLIHRHQIPHPNASRVEKVIKIIWKPLSDI